MIWKDVLWLENLTIIVTRAVGLWHALLTLVQVVPGGTVASFHTEFITVLIRVGQRSAGLVAGHSTLLVHLAFRTGHCCWIICTSGRLTFDPKPIKSKTASTKLENWELKCFYAIYSLTEACITLFLLYSVAPGKPSALLIYTHTNKTLLRAVSNKFWDYIATPAKEIQTGNFIQNKKHCPTSVIPWIYKLGALQLSCTHLHFLCNMVRHNLVKISRNVSFCLDKQVLQQFKASHPRSSQ